MDFKKWFKRFNSKIISLHQYSSFNRFIEEKLFLIKPHLRPLTRCSISPPLNDKRTLSVFSFNQTRGCLDSGIIKEFIPCGVWNLISDYCLHGTARRLNLRSQPQHNSELLAELDLHTPTATPGHLRHVLYNPLQLINPSRMRASWGHIRSCTLSPTHPRSRLSVRAETLTGPVWICLHSAWQHTAEEIYVCAAQL